MEPHDVVLAKCAAGRERDWEFARDAIRHGVVDAAELLSRVPDLPLPKQQREHIASVLRALATSPAAGA
jgi:hypothetical protein